MIYFIVVFIPNYYIYKTIYISYYLSLANNSFSEDEKENLRKLGEEIKTLQENNEILIKHSLGVINNILSGILNIAQNDKCSYNSRGLGCQDSESLDISSITEEA